MGKDENRACQTAHDRAHNNQDQYAEPKVFTKCEHPVEGGGGIDEHRLQVHQSAEEDQSRHDQSTREPGNKSQGNDLLICLGRQTADHKIGQEQDGREENHLPHGEHTVDDPPAAERHDHAHQREEDSDGSPEQTCLNCLLPGGLRERSLHVPASLYFCLCQAFAEDARRSEDQNENEDGESNCILQLVGRRDA